MGSVISGNAIDAAVAKAIPHCLSIGFGAERWVHLAVGVVVTDLFVSEQEMMWRNFTGHLQSLLSSFANLLDRKSTRLNSSHLGISYAVFCLKKKKKKQKNI